MHLHRQRLEQQWRRSYSNLTVSTSKVGSNWLNTNNINKPRCFSVSDTSRNDNGNIKHFLHYLLQLAEYQEFLQIFSQTSGDLSRQNETELKYKSKETCAKENEQKDYLWKMQQLQYQLDQYERNKLSNLTSRYHNQPKHHQSSRHHQDNMANPSAHIEAQRQRDEEIRRRRRRPSPPNLSSLKGQKLLATDSSFNKQQHQLTRHLQQNGKIDQIPQRTPTKYSPATGIETLINRRVPLPDINQSINVNTTNNDNKKKTHPTTGRLYKGMANQNFKQRYAGINKLKVTLPIDRSNSYLKVSAPSPRHNNNVPPNENNSLNVNNDKIRIPSPPDTSPVLEMEDTIIQPRNPVNSPEPSLEDLLL